MDFELSAETSTMRDLAAEILGDLVSPESLTALDQAGTWWDHATYRQLARSGILGCLVPEEFGGAGLSYLELHHVLVASGEVVAQVPMWETLVLGALPLARYGTPAQQREFLPGVVTGEVLLTAALVEPGAGDPTRPQTRAVRTSQGWQLSGVKTQVSLAQEAARVLVSASTEPGGEPALFLVDPGASGVSLEAQSTVARRPVFRMTLDRVTVSEEDRLGAEATVPVLVDLLDHATAALAAIGAGVAGRALRLAAEYTTERQQFGQPIGSFQAVRQRLADAYIDVQAMRMTALQAAWRLSTAQPAGDAVEVAKFWAADAGHRVLHTAQHVHGGMGIDLDYELHRCYRMGKWVEFTLGSATTQLRAVGRRLATQPA